MILFKDRRGKWIAPYMVTKMYQAAVSHTDAAKTQKAISPHGQGLCYINEEHNHSVPGICIEIPQHIFLSVEQFYWNKHHQRPGAFGYKCGIDKVYIAWMEKQESWFEVNHNPGPYDKECTLEFIDFMRAIS